MSKLNESQFGPNPDNFTMQQHAWFDAYRAPDDPDPGFQARKADRQTRKLGT